MKKLFATIQLELFDDGEGLNPKESYEPSEQSDISTKSNRRRFTSRSVVGDASHRDVGGADDVRDGGRESSGIGQGREIGADDSRALETNGIGVPTSGDVLSADQPRPDGDASGGNGASGGVGADLRDAVPVSEIAGEVAVEMGDWATYNPEPIGAGLVSRKVRWEVPDPEKGTTEEVTDALERIARGVEKPGDYALVAGIENLNEIVYEGKWSSEEQKFWLQGRNVSWNASSRKIREKIEKGIWEGLREELRAPSRVLMGPFYQLSQLARVPDFVREKLSGTRLTLHIPDERLAFLAGKMIKNAHITSGAMPTIPDESQDVVVMVGEPILGEVTLTDRITASKSADVLLQYAGKARLGGLVIAVSDALDREWDAYAKCGQMNARQTRRYVHSHYRIDGGVMVGEFHAWVMRRRLVPISLEMTPNGVEVDRKIGTREELREMAVILGHPQNEAGLEEVAAAMLQQVKKSESESINYRGLKANPENVRCSDIGIPPDSYGIWEGKVVVSIRGRVYRVVAETPQEEAKLTDFARLLHLARDLAPKQLKATPEQYEGALREAQEAYETFVKRWGPIHEAGVGEWLAGTTDRFIVQGLEVETYHGSGVWQMGPVLTAEYVPPPKPKEVLSAREAVYESLHRIGEVDMSYVARRSRKSEKEAREELKDLICLDPATEKWVLSDVYAVGDIGMKLDLIETMLLGPDDPQKPWLRDEYERTKRILENRLPPELSIEDIYARLSDPVIPAQAIEEFGKELFSDNTIKVVDSFNGRKVFLGTYAKKSVNALQTYAVGDLLGTELFVRAVTQGPYLSVTIRDSEEEADQLTEEEIASRQAGEVVLRNEKINQLNAAFRSCLVKNPEYGEMVAKEYNRSRNRFALPVFPDEYERPKGLNPNYELRSYQARGAYRMTMQPSTLLYHFPGSGKTITLATAIVNRLDMRKNRRILYVTLDNLLHQTYDEITHFYPHLKDRILLVGSKDIRGENAAKTAGRIQAMGTGTVLLMSYTTFSRLPIRSSVEWEKALDNVLQAEEDLRRAVTNQAREAAAKRWQKALETRDEVMRGTGVTGAHLCVDDLGDGIVFDEGDILRNLAGSGGGITMTGNRLTAHTLTYLDTMRARNPDFFVAIATGTLKSNHEAEYYTFQRFLQPEALQAAKIQSLGDWMSAYMEGETGLKMGVDGKLKNSRRYKLVNAEDLRRAMLAVLDVVTEDDLGSGLPSYRGGRPNTVVCPRSYEQFKFYQSAVKRITAIKAGLVPPEKDNALKICSESMAVALDPAFLTGDYKPNPDGKIGQATRLIVEHYIESRERKGVILVFTDLVASRDEKGKEKFNVLKVMRESLREAGLPDDEVVVWNDLSKQQRIEAEERIRRGDIRVVLTTRTGLGRGTNIQDKGEATIHLTLPWNASDLLQSMRRFRRWGNDNATIAEHFIVTENSMEGMVLEHCLRKMGSEQEFWTKGGGRVIDSLGAVMVPELKKMEAELYGGDDRLKRQAEVERDIAMLRNMIEMANVQGKRKSSTMQQLGEEIEMLKNRLKQKLVLDEIMKEPKFPLKLDQELASKVLSGEPIVPEGELRPKADCDNGGGTTENENGSKEAKLNEKALSVSLYRMVMTCAKPNVWTQIGTLSNLPLEVMRDRSFQNALEIVARIGGENGLKINLCDWGAERQVSSLRIGIIGKQWTLEQDKQRMEKKQEIVTQLETISTNCQKAEERLQELIREQEAIIESLANNPPKVPSLPGNEREVSKQEAQKQWTDMMDRLRQRVGVNRFEQIYGEEVDLERILQGDRGMDLAHNNVGTWANEK